MSTASIQQHLQSLQQQIRALESDYHRVPNCVRLIAVSKTRSAAEIRAAAQQQQLDFGENYVQEAVDKMSQLDDLSLTWHFIGPIQKNKTKLIAQHFDWAHSIDRNLIASRLNDQRPDHMTPLNVCVQINIDDEKSKSGVQPEDVMAIMQHINELPKLCLRGLMAIPSPQQQFEQQCVAFKKMHLLFNQIRANGFDIDTLSMGMSNDYTAAIANGSTMVRIGTAIFGPRK